jgi:hypothetical protein
MPANPSSEPTQLSIAIDVQVSDVMFTRYDKQGYTLAHGSLGGTECSSDLLVHFTDHVTEQINLDLLAEPIGEMLNY